MSNTCAICGRPIVDQALVCTVCTNGAIAHLAAIVRLHPDALDVARGLVRHGTGGGGGKPASRPPVNVDATDALAAVGNALTTIARAIAETRGVQIDSEPSEGRELPPPLVRAAEWLSGQMRWLRGAIDEQGQPYAPHVFAEIAHCERRMRSIVDGPSARRYLGPCGYVETPEECTRYGIGDHDCATHEPCEGNVHARVYAGGRLDDTGRCATCGARVDTAARTAWLDDEVRSRAYRLTHIADAYRINIKTLRSWAGRGQLIARGHDREGRELYLVGDALNLAADLAARRAENEAKRDRRTAARAAEEASSAA